MPVSRRSFLRGSGATLAATSVVGVSLTGREAAAQEVLYSTIEAGLDYEIEQGRVNEIKITETSPTLPPFAPAETTVDYGNVVIKYNLKRVRSDSRVPNPLNLWLFQPKPNVSNLSTIYDPPSYVGHGPKGNYTLRYPAGDNTFPRKEDTPLWNDYIAPNWDLVPGAHFTFDDLVPGAERDNTQWPGPRAVSSFRWTGNFSLFPVVVPLRVAREGIPRAGELLLTLLEIRRFGRLRLMARTLVVKPVIARDCFATSVGSIAMGSQLGILRTWRDETLWPTSIGRAFVRAYYRISPSLSDFVQHAPALRRPSQAVISMIAKRVGRRSTD